MEIKKEDHQYLSRTQIWIINALLHQMEKVDFSKISITELSKEADIARRTFYLNFASKEEVLFCYVNSLFQVFSKTLSETKSRSIYSDVKAYFDFWKEHIEFVKLLQKNKLFGLFLDMHEELMEKSPLFRPKELFEIELDNCEEQFFRSFRAAGIWNMLGKWITTGASENPEKLAGLYIKIMKYYQQDTQDVP